MGSAPHRLILALLLLAVRAQAEEVLHQPTQHILSFSKALSFRLFGSQPHDNNEFDASQGVAYDHRLGPLLTLGAEALLGASDVLAVGTGDGKLIIGHIWTFGVAPRVGVMLHLLDRLALWARVGCSLLTSLAAVDPYPLQAINSHPPVFRVLLNGELLVVITSVEHLSFDLGLTLNPVLYATSGPQVMHASVTGGVVGSW